MDDLIQRLRSAPERLLNLGPNAEKMMMEAADEIERLNNIVSRQASIIRVYEREAGDHRDIAYLRKVDAGTDNECWVVCAKGDPSAVQFQPV